MCFPKWYVNTACLHDPFLDCCVMMQLLAKNESAAYLLGCQSCCNVVTAQQPFQLNQLASVLQGARVVLEID